jgi:hypothetical protein
MSIQGSINSMIGSVAQVLAIKKVVGTKAAEAAEAKMTHQEKVERAADAKMEKQKFDTEVDDLIQKRQKADVSLKTAQDSRRETRARTGHEMAQKMNTWLGVDENE